MLVGKCNHTDIEAFLVLTKRGMPQWGCGAGHFRRAELLLQTPEKQRLYQMLWSSEGQEEQVFLQSLLFTVTDTDSV